MRGRGSLQNNSRVPVSNADMIWNAREAVVGLCVLLSVHGVL